MFIIQIDISDEVLRACSLFLDGSPRRLWTGKETQFPCSPDRFPREDNISPSTRPSDSFLPGRTAAQRRHTRRNRHAAPYKSLSFVSTSRTPYRRRRRAFFRSKSRTTFSKIKRARYAYDDDDAPPLLLLSSSLPPETLSGLRLVRKLVHTLGRDVCRRQSCGARNGRFPFKTARQTGDGACKSVSSDGKTRPRRSRAAVRHVHARRVFSR